MASGSSPPLSSVSLDELLATVSTRVREEMQAQAATPYHGSVTYDDALPGTAPRPSTTPYQAPHTVALQLHWDQVELVVSHPYSTEALAWWLVSELTHVWEPG